MPKLYGYREQIDTTLYDAFSPKDMLGHELAGASPVLRLFGNANVGNPALSNLQQGNQLGSDDAFVIFTWYARTNVTEVGRFQAGAAHREVSPRMDVIRAWDAWAHATTADLVIGCAPVRTRPLAELLGPRAFGSACGNHPASTSDIDSLASQMWKRYQLCERPDVAQMTFHDLPGDEQDRWRAAASVYPFYHPVMLPARQMFSVRLHSDPSALEALLRVLPENIAPRPLVWVHLDGIISRNH